MTILIMSCDKNKDLFLPFHHCISKYWKDHPRIVYSLETTTNPYYETINKNYGLDKWTKRVYETIQEIDDDYILLTIDDLFIRENVDTQRLLGLCEYLKDNVASINLEFTFDKQDTPLNSELLTRNRNGMYKLSCMCQIWQRKALLDLCNCDKNPWQFEKDNQAKDYDFLISKNGDYLNWGKRKDNWRWGIIKGKWSYECKEFFDKEGVLIDYEKRGFFKK